MNLEGYVTKDTKRLNLDEPGTPHRMAHALRLGDQPDDAELAGAPGVAVRRYNVTDQLSFLYRRGVITRRAYDGGLRWKVDWSIAGKEPKVVVKIDHGSRSTVESWHIKRLAARKRFTEAGMYLSQKEYAVCFGVTILDEATAGRLPDLRSGLWALADWYALPHEPVDMEKQNG